MTTESNLIHPWLSCSTTTHLILGFCGFPAVTMPPNQAQTFTRLIRRQRRHSIVADWAPSCRVRASVGLFHWLFAVYICFNKGVRQSDSLVVWLISTMTFRQCDGNPVNPSVYWEALRVASSHLRTHGTAVRCSEAQDEQALELWQDADGHASVENAGSQADKEEV